MHAKIYIPITEFCKSFELLNAIKSGGNVNIKNMTGKRISAEKKKLTR
jgi:hypothetical protein